MRPNAGRGLDQVRSAHERLLEQIDAGMRRTVDSTGRDRLSPDVRRAMERVRREAFVPESEIGNAYRNAPLPIGHGQTISQPFVVALMTELLDPGSSDVVLEIGTGSGYETAVLAEIVEQVYSVEVVSDLARSAHRRLQNLGYQNIEILRGDGNEGWADHAPYDAVMVTAAAPEIPEPLIEQLACGGRMVVPVGETYGPQELLVLEKDEAGVVTERAILSVAFVPLVRGN